LVRRDALNRVAGIPADEVLQVLCAKLTGKRIRLAVVFKKFDGQHNRVARTNYWLNLQPLIQPKKLLHSLNFTECTLKACDRDRFPNCINIASVCYLTAEYGLCGYHWQRLKNLYLHENVFVELDRQ
jgi:hypothetical protein